MAISTEAVERLMKRCQIGVGGRDAPKEQHHLRYRMWPDESIKRIALQHELKALRAEMEKQS